MSAQALALTPLGIPLVFQGQFWTSNTGLSTGTAAGNGTFTIPVPSIIPTDYICTVVIQQYQSQGGSINYPGFQVALDQTQGSYWDGTEWVINWSTYNPAVGNDPEVILCQYLAFFSPSQLISVDT
jgi:hypothetical protein